LRAEHEVRRVWLWHFEADTQRLRVLNDRRLKARLASAIPCLGNVGEACVYIIFGLRVDHSREVDRTSHLSLTNVEIAMYLQSAFL
jgi:hypothetical protein